MSKSAALLLALVFLSALCVAVNSAFSSEEIKENAWVSKASMHVARSGLGAAVVNGKIYAIGGLTRSGTAPNVSGGTVGVNEEYDPVTDIWTYKEPMPTPRDYFAIAAYQNKIYCIGSGVNEVYDTETDTWETKTPMPTARYGVQANAVNGKIYLIGGYAAGNSSNRLTLNEVYDPATDSWTTKASMPNITYGCVSAVVDNKICFVSGLSRVQIYDAETDTWSLGESPPSSEYHGAAVAAVGVMAPKRVYVLGVSGQQSVGEPEDFVRVYDLESDSWSFGADIPTRRYDFAIAVVNDKLYVIGGNTLDYPEGFGVSHIPNLVQYATVEQYTPFGYGTVPPVVNVVSPEKNGTYVAGNVSLAFVVNKPVSWVGYSVDGQDNVTVTINMTLADLSSGSHNVTLYARDEFGNIGASETTIFTVAELESFPVVPVVAASVASVVVVGVGLLVYFRKRNHKSEAGLVKKP